MDLVPTTMLASATPVPSTAATATPAPTSGFAVMLATVEQSGSAAVPPIGKEQTPAGRDARAGLSVQPVVKASKTATQKTQSGTKAELAPGVVIAATMPILPPGFRVPTESHHVTPPIANKANGAESTPAISVSQKTANTQLTPAPIAGGAVTEEAASVAAIHTGSNNPATVSNARATPEGTSTGPAIPGTAQNEYRTNNGQQLSPGANSGDKPVASPNSPGLGSANAASHPAIPPIPAQPEVKTVSETNAPTSTAEGPDISERSQSIVSNSRISPALPASSTVSVHQVMSAVAATAAAHGASTVSGTASIKVPAVSSEGRQLASTHSREESRLPASADGNASAKPHAPAETERGGSDAGGQSQPANVTAASAATLTNNSVNESGSAQPKVFLSQVQAATGLPTAIAEAHDSSAVIAQTPSDPALPSPQHLPTPVVSVNSAALLDQMGKSELKLGMRVGDFGSVEIHTQLDRQQLKADISVDHRELGHALNAELPSLQQKLHEHDMPAISLNLTGQGAGEAGAHSGYRNNPATAKLDAGLSTEKIEPISSPEETAVSSGLDIRI